MTRRNGVVHVGWPDGYFTDPARQLEVSADMTATWQLSGYLVCPVPRDGRPMEHTFNEPCPACGLDPADTG